MTSFSFVFLFALLAATGLQLWLKTRQLRHVAAHRATVPADYAALIPLEAHQKAADYTSAKTRFARWVLLWDAVLVWALTLGGGIGLLDAWARRVAGEGLMGGLLLFLALGAVTGLMGLPWSWWSTFRIEQRFGFNTMTPKLWVQDAIKGTLLSAALGLPLAALVLWLVTVSGPLWWLYAWIVWVVFVLLLQAIAPSVIMPLFNRFEPLADGPMRRRIEALLAKCGFASNGVFVMDGSKRSSHGNAFFAGIGAKKRIVFFDTLLDRLSEDEVEAVLAHELGHYAHRHVVKRMVVGFGVALGALALLGWLMAQPWFYSGLGVVHPSNAAAFALFFVALPVFTVPFAWIGSRASRSHEYEADRYAARHSSASALIAGLTKLYRDNAATLTPDPLHSLFYDSHPPAALRIAALRAAASA